MKKCKFKLFKNYKDRTISICKLAKGDYKEIARLSLDDIKELANNFDLDIQYCDEIK